VRSLITSAAVVLGLLSAGASPAFAAKGVKKKGVHHVHGVVTQVNHHKGQKGGGEFFVKTHHHKKKGQAAAVGQKGAGQTHKFTFGAGTRFTVVNKKQQGQAGANALRAGEHVMITHKGNHAEVVAIHSNAKNVKKKKKLK
jgi:hypothetical protein